MNVDRPSKKRDSVAFITVTTQPYRTVHCHKVTPLRETSINRAEDGTRAAFHWMRLAGLILQSKHLPRKHKVGTASIFFAAATFHAKTFARQWQTTFGYLSKSRNPMDGVSNHDHQGAILTERPIFASIRILSTQFQTGLTLSASDRGWV